MSDVILASHDILICAKQSVNQATGAKGRQNFEEKERKKKKETRKLCLGERRIRGKMTLYINNEYIYTYIYE